MLWLMAAIIQRAVDDLPASGGCFQIGNGMFRLCCEALNINPDEVRAQIEKKHSFQSWSPPYIFQGKPMP
jgi:hypothetical protein